MKLIIGGAFQGKKEYAKQQFQIPQEEMLDGAEASYEALFQCTCMFHFHEWVKRALQESARRYRTSQQTSAELHSRLKNGTLLSKSNTPPQAAGCLPPRAVVKWTCQHAHLARCLRENK